LVLIELSLSQPEPIFDGFLDVASETPLLALGNSRSQKMFRKIPTLFID
jgi:hypothetical protein